MKSCMISCEFELLQLSVRLDDSEAAFREKLNTRYQANLYDQISYAGEYLRIRRLLDASGVSVVPFKGFWLALQDSFTHRIEVEVQAGSC